MIIVGLTGGSGTGKSVVSAAFSRHNFASIDTDAVYHDITSKKNSPCLSALTDYFGDEILTGDGVLDRRVLAKAVFSDGKDEKRKKLNEITHAFVLAEVRREIPKFEGQGYKGVLVDAPLLFESGFDAECDIILCVLAKKDTRIRRIIARDGITKEMAERRISSQLDEEYLIAHSDFVIRNDASEEDVVEQVAKIVKMINNKFKGDKNNGREE